MSINKHKSTTLTTITLILLAGSLAWWGWAGEAEIQSRLIFPDLTQTSGVQVGYALTAADGGFHQVTLTAYANDGTLIEGGDIENPVNMNLFNFAQESLLAADIFNFPPEMEVEGWIEATSTGADLKGFFLTLENVLERVDGADAILEPSLLAILPVPANAQVNETQIHVVNVGESMNQTSVRLVSNSGAVLQEAQRALPPHGKLRESLSNLLPMSAQTNDFYLVVEGDGELAAYELVRAGNSVAGFNGIVPAEADQLFSPQLATGPGLETSLQLTNTSGLGVAAAGAQTINLEITARGEDGQALAAASQNPRQISLAAGELFQMDAASFFGVPLDVLRSGWVEIRNRDGGPMPVSGSVSFGSGGLGQFNAALPLLSEGRLINTFSHIAQGEFGPINWFTGLAFLFTGEGETEVFIVVRNSEGGITGRGQVTLSTNNRISQTLPELVPGFNTQAGGSVQVTSNKPVMAFSLFGLVDLSVLAAIPTQPLLNILRTIGQADFDLTVGPGVPAPDPRTLPDGRLTFFSLRQNECAAGAPVGRAVSADSEQSFSQTFPSPQGDEEEEEAEDLFSTLLRIKHDSLPYFREPRGPQGGLDEEIEEFCDYLERSYFSGEGIGRESLSEGRLRSEISRFVSYLQDDFLRSPGVKVRPAGDVDPLRLFYFQPLGDFDLGADNLVIEVPRNDCSPPPAVLVDGEILVPESLVGTIDIDLNFIDPESGTNSVAVVDDSALQAAGGGIAAVAYEAAVPAGSFFPVFRIGNRGLVEGPTSSGTIALDPIQVGDSNISLDLQFPELIAITGNAQDSEGNALSLFRGMIFTSERAELFSDRETTFRVLVPVGHQFTVEINRDLRPTTFTAGRGAFEVLQFESTTDMDIGNVQFPDLPDFEAVPLEFLDSRGEPLEDALISAEVLELEGVPAGFSFFPRGARSEADGVGVIELLPGRYRMTVDCEQCR